MGSCATNTCDLLWWPTLGLYVSDMYCVTLFVFSGVAGASLWNASAYLHCMAYVVIATSRVWCVKWLAKSCWHCIYPAFPTRVCGYDSGLIQQHFGQLSYPLTVHSPSWSLCMVWENLCYLFIAVTLLQDSRGAVLRHISHPALSEWCSHSSTS